MENFIKFGYYKSIVILMIVVVTFTSNANVSSVQATYSYVSVGGTYTSDLVINTGQIAEVTSDIIMTGGTQITIERGAILYCVNKTIGSNAHRFVGIEVQGDPTANQNLEKSIICDGKLSSCYPFSSGSVNACIGSFTNGILYFENSTLLNSYAGIQTGDLSSNTDDYNNGYLYILNSTFIGNISSLTIKNKSTSTQIFKGVIEGNLFHTDITDPLCTVLWDTDVDHIFIKDYLALENAIKDNFFESAAINDQYFRLCGITAFNSGFRAESNTFKGLNEGIYNSSAKPQVLSKVFIYNNVFDQCFVSIVNLAPEKMEIFQNKFILFNRAFSPGALQMTDINNGPNYILVSGGIVNLLSTNYDIANNIFRTANNSTFANFGITASANSSLQGACLITANKINNCQDGLAFFSDNTAVRFYCNEFSKTGYSDIHIDAFGFVNSIQGRLGLSNVTVNNKYARNLIGVSTVTNDLVTDNTAGFNISYYFSNTSNARDKNLNIIGSGLNEVQVSPSDGSFLHCAPQSFLLYKDKCGNFINGGNGSTYGYIISTLTNEYIDAKVAKESIEDGGISGGEEEEYKQILSFYDYDLAKLINAYSEAYIYNFDSSEYYINQMDSLLDHHTTRYGNYLKGALYLELKNYSAFNDVVYNLRYTSNGDDVTLADYFVKLMEYDTSSDKSNWISGNFNYLKTLADTLRDSTSIVSGKVMAWVQQLVDLDTLSQYHGKIYYGLPELSVDTLQTDTTIQGPQFTSSVSPNPFTNSISIDLENERNSSRNIDIIVIDMYNSIMDTDNKNISALDSDNVGFNTSSWPSGLYFVLIMEGVEELNYHLIVK